MINPPITTAITDAAYVAVSLPAGQDCASFSLWTEDGTDYYLSSLADGSDAILVPNGFPMNLQHKARNSKAGTVLCYAKGTTSTNLVGLITK